MIIIPDRSEILSVRSKITIKNCEKRFAFKQLRKLNLYLLWFIFYALKIACARRFKCGTQIAFITFDMRKLTLIPPPGTVTFATNSLALVIALVFSLAIASAQSEARAEQGSLLPSNICERHIDAAEISLNIPRQLLLAISVVESGVWNEERLRSTP